jgi:hypothetical protein
VLAFVNRLHKTETQLLTVQFKSGLGDNQTMTLQLAKPAASSVLATIEGHTPKAVTAVKAPAPLSKDAQVVKDAKTATDAKDAWWGDEYWKTVRNQDSWKAASTNTTASTK